MKIAKKILVILLIVCILPMPKIDVSLAANSWTQAQSSAGQAIAEFAKNAVNHSGEFHYVQPSKKKYRIDSYNNIKSYYCDGTCAGTCADGAGAYYGVDCNAFVGFVVHYSIGLGPVTGTAVSNITVAGPGATSWSVRNAWTPYFEKVASGLSASQAYSQAIPGDLLASVGDGNTHIQIYIGNNSIVDCAGYYPNAIKVRAGASNNRHSGGKFCIIRIKDSAAQNITSRRTWVDAAQIGMPDGSAGGNNNNLYDEWVFDNIDRNTYEEYKNKDYYWDGMTTGEYKGNGREKNWLFNFLNDALDWILGIATLGIRIQVVGWTTIFEVLVTNIVNAIGGDNEVAKMSLFEQLEKVERITAEKIIYNRIPLLDANILNTSEAGGEPIDTSGITYIIRQSISNWYYIFRYITIIAMLMLLIYIGIRMAISSTGQKKAEYKRLIKDWLTSFIIVFFIHYFMIVIFGINDGILSIFEPKGNEDTLYESIREHLYTIPFKTSWQATIIYLMLIYMLVRFAFFYTKRLFTILILIAIAPIMVIAHVFKRVQNAKDNILGTWAKEFTFNVLIQSFHALLYVIFFSTALDIATSGNLAQFAAGTVLIIIIIKFIFQAEDILKKIFGLQASTMKGLSDSLTGALAGYYFAKNITSSVISKGTGIVKWGANKINNASSPRVRTKQTPTVVNNTNSSKQYEGNEYVPESVRAAKAKKSFSGIEAQLKELQNRDMEHLKQYTTQGVKGVANVLGSIPTAFISPIVGLNMFTSGMGQIKKISGYQKLHDRHYKGRRILSYATLGASTIVPSLYNKAMKERQEAKTVWPKEKEILLKAQEEEGTLVEQIEVAKQDNPLIFAGYREKATDVQKEMSKKGEIELIEALNRELEIAPSREKIKQTISEYMIENNKEKLSKTDVKKVVEKMGLTIGDEFDNNLEKSYQNIFVPEFGQESNANSQKSTAKKSEIKKVAEKMELTTGERVGNNSEKTFQNISTHKYGQEGNTNSQKSTTQKSDIKEEVEEMEVTAREKGDNNLEKFYQNIFVPEFGQESNKNTQKDTTKKAETIQFGANIDKLNIGEIAEVMHGALKMKDSTIYKKSDKGILKTQQPIINQARKLKELNQQMEATRGKGLYPSSEALRDMIINRYKTQ